MKTPPLQPRMQTKIQPLVGGPGKPAAGAAKVGLVGGKAPNGPLAAAYGTSPVGLPGAGVDRVDRVTLTAGGGAGVGAGAVFGAGRVAPAAPAKVAGHDGALGGMIDVKG